LPFHSQAAGELRIDVALLDRVIARDPNALGELYDTYSRLLFSLILRILKKLFQPVDLARRHRREA
jgi:hypothetical protein